MKYIEIYQVSSSVTVVVWVVVVIISCSIARVSVWFCSEVQAFEHVLVKCWEVCKESCECLFVQRNADWCGLLNVVGVDWFSW
jgi:hypothetical protein